MVWHSERQLEYLGCCNVSGASVSGRTAFCMATKAAKKALDSDVFGV